jgi:anaerobic selenocysteine-containing dehydrogenase
VALQRAAPTRLGTPIMHVDGFVRGKGRFIITEYVATDEKVTRRFPLLLTTGRILSQYNVGAQTRRTANNLWHSEDRLEIHPHDAEERGIKEATGWASRAAPARPCCAPVTERMQPGVVYTTFHFPRVGRQRHHHRQLRLGHQLPRVQGHRGAGDAGGAALEWHGSVTGLAVDVAQRSGLTLAGFVRGENVSIYSHPQRFELD